MISIDSYNVEFWDSEWCVKTNWDGKENDVLSNNIARCQLRRGVKYMNMNVLFNDYYYALGTCLSGAQNDNGQLEKAWRQIAF